MQFFLNFQHKTITYNTFKLLEEARRIKAIKMMHIKSETSSGYS